jgi:Acetoacetate decarboxylase (ADC)
MIRLGRIIFLLILMFSYFGCVTESGEVVKRPNSPPVKLISLENEQIYAYFEAANIQEYQKLVPSIFSMPERPLCRVVIVDFYKMEAGPPFREVWIQILVKYKKSQNEKEMLAWYYIEEPVTTEEALWGRFTGGFPKFLRKITFERYENKYVGTSYGRDGKTIALRLVLDTKKTGLTADEETFLNFVSPMRALTIKDGKVLEWGTVGGGKYKVQEVEKVRPEVYQVRFATCSIDYSKDPENYLQRLDIGRCISAYWLRLKLRYQLGVPVEGSAN